MGMPDIVMCSLLVNRPVRTRMPWWCGDWGLETPGYPIGQARRLAREDLRGNCRIQWNAEFLRRSAGRGVGIVSES